MTTTPPADYDPNCDYQETVKVHDGYSGGAVIATCRVTCEAFGNDRVSLRITDAVSGRSTWVWMTAADAAMLGGALVDTAGVAAPADDDGDEGVTNIAGRVFG